MGLVEQSGRRWANASIAIAAALILIVMVDPAAAQRRNNAPDTFADLADRLSPAVVNVSTSQFVRREGEQDMPFEQFPPGHPFGDLFRDWLEQNPDGTIPPQQAASLGSGFVVDASGIVVTNYHVVQGADAIQITLTDGTVLNATMVGADEPTDLAVLRVNTEHPLVAVSFGDSDEMRVGDWVMAIGNPFGLGGTVTAGIVSARNRDIYSGPYDDFIQTDAAINQGNSGGPLFSLDGEVIGVNSAIISPSGGSIGIGFAIPSTTAALVVRQILEYGETRRGWLGVRIQTVTEQIAQSVGLDHPQGALISAITPGGPADEAGLQRGDVVMEFDGTDIDRMRALPRIVSQTEVGERVPIRVWRDGRERTMRVVVGELDETLIAALDVPDGADDTATDQIDQLGLSLSEITPQLRDQFGLRQSAEGVVVTNVDPSAPASQNVRAGDVILEVEREIVRGVEDIRTGINRAASSERDVVLFLIERGGQATYQAVELVE